MFVLLHSVFESSDFVFQDNICSVLHTLKNEEFLPKMRELEISVHSMAAFQKQFATFFNDKVDVEQFSSETFNILHTYLVPSQFFSFFALNCC